jgi:hypothetical protein
MLRGFVGLRPVAAPQPAVARAAPAAGRRQLAARASVIAPPATLEVKTLDGAAAGTATLSLRVADDDVAKGLVHRYLVLVRQNARRVSADSPPHAPPPPRLRASCTSSRRRQPRRGPIDDANWLGPLPGLAASRPPPARPPLARSPAAPPSPSFSSLSRARPRRSRAARSAAAAASPTSRRAPATRAAAPSARRSCPAAGSRSAPSRATGRSR